MWTFCPFLLLFFVTVKSLWARFTSLLRFHSFEWEAVSAFSCRKNVSVPFSKRNRREIHPISRNWKHATYSDVWGCHWGPIHTSNCMWIAQDTMQITCSSVQCEFSPFILNGLKAHCAKSSAYTRIIWYFCTTSKHPMRKKSKQLIQLVSHPADPCNTLLFRSKGL